MLVVWLCQMFTILKSRLRSLPVFTDDALELCARKVRSVSGDVRRALQLCRRAIELRIQRLKDASAGEDSTATSELKDKIGSTEIHKADLNIRASNHCRLIASGTYYERVAIVGLVS